jgi:hypothetical protein
MQEFLTIALECAIAYGVVVVAFCCLWKLLDKQDRASASSEAKNSDSNQYPGLGGDGVGVNERLILVLELSVLSREAGELLCDLKSGKVIHVDARTNVDRVLGMCGIERKTSPVDMLSVWGVDGDTFARFSESKAGHDDCNRQRCAQELTSQGRP